MRRMGRCKRVQHAQYRGGGELSRKGGEGKSRVEGSRERLLLRRGPELLRDLAKDRQRAADLSPLCTLSLARALQGRGELVT